MNKASFSKLETLIQQEYSNTTGIVIYKNQQLVYENYFNQYQSNDPVHIFSITKSIISILIGIAIDKGYIKGPQQNILDFFPEYKAKEKLKNLTLEQLLTMTAAYSYDTEPYAEYFISQDRVIFSLDCLAEKTAAEAFRYTPIVGPDILSGILVKATGQAVLDFANQHLFLPLGISVEKNIFFNSQDEQMTFYEKKVDSGWVADATGINAASWGLTLTCKDLNKIGQLYLANGQWQKKQFVSSHWIKESTRKQSHWEEAQLDYGYLWWIVGQNEYVAMGDGGNILYVDTEEKLVVAMTALFVPEAKDRISLIKEQIVPILNN